MLKQCKRLLYILGVVMLSLLHSAAFSQGSSNPIKTVPIDVCMEIAMPIDLFQALGIQISPYNGYWTDGSGKVVDNIFDASNKGVGIYDFTFTMTTEKYCEATVGEYFEVIVIIKDGKLKVKLAEPIMPDCNGVTNGSITIEGIEYGTGNYKYMLAKKIGDNNEKETIKEWTVITPPPIPPNPLLPTSLPVTIAGLTDGEFYLSVEDLLKDISCTSVHIDTIQLAYNVEIVFDATEVRGPSKIEGGLFLVDEGSISGGTPEYVVTWYLVDANGDIDEDNPIAEGMSLVTKHKQTYRVRVTDSNGCFTEKDIKPTDQINPLFGVILQSAYFFCQDNFREMLSGEGIEPKTVFSLLRKTSKNPDSPKWDEINFIKVYDGETGSEEANADWFVNAVINGLTENDATITKWIEITIKGTTLARQKITVKIFNRPQDLSLRVVQNKSEWDVNDMVRFETSPAGMDWYHYFLNNNLKGSVEGSNLFEIHAMDFTGTVQDMMKVHVDQKVSMVGVQTPPVSKDSTCTWIITQPIIINIPFPNTFTPDGDGVNDVFLGGVKFGNREFNLEIINRYGNRLYSGDKGWDGTYKGSEVASGTYFYVVHIKTADGTTKTLKGAVTLIRNKK